MSTNDQDLTAQKNALLALGVAPDKSFTHQGLTGAGRLPKRGHPCRDHPRPPVLQTGRLSAGGSGCTGSSGFAASAMSW